MVTQNALDGLCVLRDGFRGEAELLAGVQSEDMRIVMPNGWWDCVCFTSSGEDVLAFQTKARL